LLSPGCGLPGTLIALFMPEGSADIMETTIISTDKIDVALGHQELMAVRTSDGVVIPMRYWPGREQRGAVLFVHGMLSHSAWFIPTGDWLNQLGFTCVALDRRGSGRSEEARGHMLSYHQLVDEIEGAVGWLESEHPGAPIHLAGQCYGALPVLRFAAAHPERCRSLTLLSPSIRVHATLTLREKLLVALLAKVRPTHPMRVPLKPEHFTDLPEHLEFIRGDALRLQYVTTAFYLQTLLMMLAVRGSADRIVTPTFIALAGRDEVCDNAAAERFFSQLAAEDKRLTTYPGSMHSLEYGRDRLAFLADYRHWLADHDQIVS